MKFSPGVQLGWLERHPWLVVSALLHLAALVALAALRPVEVLDDGMRRVRTEADVQRVSASLQAARRQQMQREVAALEKLQRELAGTANPPAPPLPEDPAALRERAQQIARQLHAQQQQRRAEELAQLLKIPPAEALRRVQADPRQAPPPAQASVAELLQGARAQQHAQQARAQAAREGLSARREAGRAAGASAQADGQGQMGSGRGTGSGVGDDIGRLEGPRGGTAQDHRSYGPLMGSATLDPATLRLQQGRRLGEGGAFATRVLLDRWWWVGPFDGPSLSALVKPYPPELAVDLHAVYEGKDRRLLQWQMLSAPPYPLVPNPRHAHAVYYASTEIYSERAQTVWLEIGTDDDARLWLNDELVWEGEPTHDKPWYRRPYYALHERLAQRNLVEARVPVRLRAGRNTVLLKLYNGIDLTFFSVVLSA